MKECSMIKEEKLLKKDKEIILTNMIISKEWAFLMLIILIQIGKELLGNLDLDKEMLWNILEAEETLLQIIVEIMVNEIKIMGMEDLRILKD